MQHAAVMSPMDECAATLFDQLAPRLEAISERLQVLESRMDEQRLRADLAEQRRVLKNYTGNGVSLFFARPVCALPDGSVARLDVPVRVTSSRLGPAMAARRAKVSVDACFVMDEARRAGECREQSAASESLNGPSRV